MIRVRTTSRTRPGFTLVEMLTVIVIIGILASLITAAAIRARTTARVAVIKAEINQIEMALDLYKKEVGEYPPDFASWYANPTVSNTSAIKEIERHILKRFPQYDYQLRGSVWKAFVWDLAHYGQDSSGNPVAAFPAAANPAPNTSDPNYGAGLQLDPAAALAFWLGGLPESVPLSASEKWMPAGFHADPRQPFKAGLPRTKRYLEFKTDEQSGVPRLSQSFFDGSAWQNGDATGPLRYYPTAIPQTPYVYFRAQRSRDTGRWEYGQTSGGSFVPYFYKHNGDSYNYAVPYLELSPDLAGSAPNAGAAATKRPWRNMQTVQIIAAGLDGEFGDETAKFRYTRSGLGFSSEGRDRDNIVNFTDGGTLEDEL